MLDVHRKKSEKHGALGLNIFEGDLDLKLKAQRSIFLLVRLSVFIYV